jgi:hypothetical protein
VRLFAPPLIYAPMFVMVVARSQAMLRRAQRYTTEVVGFSNVYYS